MENINNEKPFIINLPPDKRKKIVKDFEEVNDFKSAIHFINNYKKYVMVNKKFKKKVVNFSIKTVASLSTMVMIISYIKFKSDKNKTEDITPVETTISYETDEIKESDPSPILSSKSLEEIDNNSNNNIMPNISEVIEENNIENINDDIVPTYNLLFPKASDTNEESDYTNYYNVKEKFGKYIDKLSKESGVDSRIIIAMIAQDNPNGIDETNVGTYGPMCVTSVHNGETYNYYHFNDDNEYVCEKVTININNLKPFAENNELYENGEYGNITNAEAWCLFYGVVITKDYYNQINSSNNLASEENIALAVASYNHGNNDVIRITKYSPTLFDACYSIRYDHASDSYNDDDQYMEHVFNKIPDEELTKPFTFVDNDGKTLCFSLERNNEIATISSEQIINHKRAK